MEVCLRGSVWDATRQISPQLRGSSWSQAYAYNLLSSGLLPLHSVCPENAVSPRYKLPCMLAHMWPHRFLPSFFQSSRSCQVKGTVLNTKYDLGAKVWTLGATWDGKVANKPVTQKVTFSNKDKKAAGEAASMLYTTMHVLLALHVLRTWQEHWKAQCHGMGGTCRHSLAACRTLLRNDGPTY